MSWRVEAVRYDAWVRANQPPVEIEKSLAERGRLQPIVARTVRAAEASGDLKAYETTKP